MSISSGPLLSKPPSERTFVVAVTLLSIVAVIQGAAVLVAVIPEIHLDKSAAAPQASGAPTAAESAPPAPAPTPTIEAIQQANGLLAQAETLRGQGKFEDSLAVLDQADHLVPDEPGIRFQIGMTLRELGRDAEAVKYLQQVVSSPKAAGNATYSVVLQQAQAALAELGGGAPQNPAAPPADAQTGQPAAAAASGAQPDSRMRDEVGIPIGSVIGIVDVRLRDGGPGEKKLRVDTKASTKAQIDPKALRTMVYFFEQNDHGDVSQTQSTVVPEWLSPPVDWKNGDPELLEVTYPLPKDNRGDLPPLQYYGYMVGVYYKGELQDFRAEPVSLADEFPLKYSLGGGE